MRMPSVSHLKPLRWIGSSYKDLCNLPAEVRSHMGYALFVAQAGGKHRDAKPLKGFGGAGGLGIVADRRGGTFRAMYTVGFAQGGFRVPVFLKKRTAGLEDP